MTKIEKFKKKIRENVVLAPYTTYKIGGPAKYFFEAKNAEEISEALKWCRAEKLPYFILGGGSNLLISDNGFNGMVIRVQSSGFRVQGNCVEAGAGVSIARLIQETKKRGLSGCEYLSGLPGTLGGAIFGNAGSTRYGWEIGDLIVSVDLLFPNDRITRVKKSWFKFTYRYSRLKDFLPTKRPIILNVKLRLKKDKKANIEKRIKEIALVRSQKIPWGFSAGCVFKNVEVKDLKGTARKVLKILPANILKGRKEKDFKIPAAWLIEQCGLKGKTIGGAEISEKHANFFLNRSLAKASDIKALVDLARARVKEKFDIILEDENILVGF